MRSFLFAGRASCPVAPVCAMPPFAKRLIAAALCISVVACATKGETGALIGAGIGGILGHAIGGKDGAVIGAALGLMIGGGIGASMDAEDKKRLAEARTNAAQTAQRQSFYSPSAKATVVVEAAPSQLKEQSRLAIAADVVDARFIDQTPTTVTAYVNTPVYAAPDYDTIPKLLVPRGEPITQIAAIAGNDNWVLVGRSGFGIGYVHKQFLEPKVADDVIASTTMSKSKTVEKASAKKPVRTPTQKPSTVAKQPNPQTPATPSKTEGLLASGATYLPPNDHLTTVPVDRVAYNKSLEAGSQQAKDALVNPSQARNVKVLSTSVECRELTSILLSNNKETSREKTTACKKADGSWTV